jgi:predicted type IV restriction endonuclease
MQANMMKVLLVFGVRIMEISFGLGWIIFETFTHTNNRRDEMYTHTQLHYISVRAAENKIQVFEQQKIRFKCLSCRTQTLKSEILTALPSDIYQK